MLTLSALLDAVAKDQPFRFEIKENTKTIVIAPKPATPQVVRSLPYPLKNSAALPVSRAGDGQYGRHAAMPGASISIRGKQKNVVTDANGRLPDRCGARRCAADHVCGL